jgi:Fur family iron response transcriptional regulator
VHPTAQRVAVAYALFNRGTHLAAEDLYQLVKSNGTRVSKATVYNTLGALAKKGVIREVIADPNRVFYDPNTSPHHHFYNETTGELTDISVTEVEVTGLPQLPTGVELHGIDVIFRLRPKKIRAG